MKEKFNVEDLRNSLIDSFQQLKKGKLLPKEAKEISSMSGKILSSAKLQMDYNRMMKYDNKIDFIEPK